MKYFLLFIAMLCFCTLAEGQSQLVRNLQAGKDQALLIYGTSLSASAGGKAWVDSVKRNLNAKYNNHLTVYNSAKGGMWSGWAVKNIEDSVIKKKPDAVIIEFAINDAFLDYKTSPELARLNLNYMIDRILLDNPRCEVILQIMNMPVNKSADLRPNLQAYYDMYREVSRKRKLLLIDHYPHWKKILHQGKEAFLKYVPDGIHPDPASTRAVTAPYVLERLEQGR